MPKEKIPRITAATKTDWAKKGRFNNVIKPKDPSRYATNVSNNEWSDNLSRVPFPPLSACASIQGKCMAFNYLTGYILWTEIPKCCQKLIFDSSFVIIGLNVALGDYYRKSTNYGSDDGLYVNDYIVGNLRD